MLQQIIDTITGFWTDRILHGADSATLSTLSKAETPDRIRQGLVSRGERVVRRVLTGLFEAPFINLTPAEVENSELMNKLMALLKDHVVLSREKVSEIVSATYSELFNRWSAEPLKQNLTGDTPAQNAAEVFNRALLLSTSGAEGDKFGLEMISMVCQASGLPLIAEAVKVEKALGMKKLDREQFSIIFRRVLMLKEHFKGEKQVEAPGDRMVEEAPPTEAVMNDYPSARYEEEQVVPGMRAPVNIAKSVPFEEMLLDVESAGRALSETEEIGIKAQDDYDMRQPAAYSAALEEDDEILDELSTDLSDEEPGEALQILMFSEENIEYFTRNIFKGDVEAYRDVIERIAMQKTLGNALTIANNELFLRNAPPSSKPAARFIKIIKRLFK